MLHFVRKLDPKGTWVEQGPLAISNGEGFVVNLHRFWPGCREGRASCSPDLQEYAAKMLQITRGDAVPPSRSRLVAVIRHAEYLQSIPDAIRIRALVEPLVADLVVVYMVDGQGAARGATLDDLPGLGVDRSTLPAVARANLAALLPELPFCREEGVTLIAAENYYESSRLLLPSQWPSATASSALTVVVAVPSNDKIVVACNPDQTTLDKLAPVVDEIWSSADRPISRAFLKWTSSGWQPLDGRPPLRGSDTGSRLKSRAPTQLALHRGRRTTHTPEALSGPFIPPGA